MRNFVCCREVVLWGDGNSLRLLSLHECAFYVEPPYKTLFPASFAPAKLVRAVTPLYLSNNSLCRPQINRAVHEVNDLARKNKDSIEGLAEEVGNFRV